MEYSFGNTKLFGADRQFRALSGVVLHSSQRSDTHISGGIRTPSQGKGARTPIRTEIVITSNIWLKTLDGTEKKLTYARDIQFRPGSVIHIVDVCDKKGKPLAKSEVLIYDSTSKEVLYGEGAYNSKVMQQKRGKKLLHALMISFVGVFSLNLFYSTSISFAEKLQESFSRGVLFGAFLTLPIFYLMISWQRRTKAHNEIGKKFEPFAIELDQIANKFQPI